MKFKRNNKYSSENNLLQITLNGKSNLGNINVSGFYKIFRSVSTGIHINHIHITYV